ncbi:helix-turn-helix domain-containing protein [Thalassomonas actiniarum]|uniref:Helix-turn-helix transcriptional regulator n=1 Tax=Thalassomonas actiniarum TaxID=485447 RepID=A0AAE9YPP2_9GAMM|nr:helix-turn-helix transcriptional regulator [Thalassomonas actiniarum]WDD98974.1 helix-turn-helix transcriptional regulator [Thalassomonas actiniarum]
MTLGEQFKQLRHELGLSQPELAQLAGIEQSYLSKLENDKSVPSNEIFRSLLKAFNLELNQFLARFDLNTSRGQLSQIPDIEHWLKQQQQQQSTKQRRYLYSCSALIVIAVTLFYTGFSTLLFGETRYQYESQGVVLPGEPKDIFSSWSRLISGNGDEHRRLHIKKKMEMVKRKDAKYLLLWDNLGPHFTEQVSGGLRFYQLDKHEQEPRLINALLQILAVMLFSAGIMGFVLERKLFKQ